MSGTPEPTKCIAICYNYGRPDKALSALRRGGVDGAVLANEAFALRFFGEDFNERDDRLLIVDFSINVSKRPGTKSGR